MINYCDRDHLAWEAENIYYLLIGKKVSSHLPMLTDTLSENFLNY